MRINTLEKDSSIDYMSKSSKYKDTKNRTDS